MRHNTQDLDGNINYNDLIHQEMLYKVGLPD